MINLPAIKIVRTPPPSSLGEGSVVDNRLMAKPVAPGVWDEFLALQISPATRSDPMQRDSETFFGVNSKYRFLQRRF